VSGASADKSPPLNIRIKGPQRALIERAAKQADKSISDFVRDAALQEAQNALLDTTRIELDPAAWKKGVFAQPTHWFIRGPSLFVPPLCSPRKICMELKQRGPSPNTPPQFPRGDAGCVRTTALQLAMPV